MRPIELIPQTIDVTNNGLETLVLPYDISIQPGATVTVQLYKFTGGPSSGPGLASAGATGATGVSLQPSHLDPETPSGTIVGTATPGSQVGVPGDSGPRNARYAGAGTHGASAIFGPVHIEGDSPRQRLWNAIVASAQSGIAIITGLAVSTGGTGYTGGLVYTVVGGESTTPASFMVTALTGASGAMYGVTMVAGGTYDTLPSSPASVNGPTGTGAQLTLTTISKVTSLANQTVGTSQPNVAVGAGASYYGEDLDYQTPWQKRKTTTDTSVRVVGSSTKGFNTPPTGGAAVVGIIPRNNVQ